MKDSIVYFDGAFIEENKALVPITDRGFLFGDGLYVTIQVREGVPLFLQDHLKRLQANCHIFRILPPEVDESAIYTLIEKNRAESGIYKLQIFVTGGEEPMRGLPPRRHGHLLIKMAPFTPPASKPLFCLFYPDPIATPHSHVKTLAHLNRYFVADFARLNNADDALTRWQNGVLLEASFANLFWVVGDVLFTPSHELPLHRGVTITKLIELAPRLNLTVKEVVATLDEIPPEASLFRISSMANVMPIERVEQRLFHLNENLANRCNQLLDEEASAMGKAGKR